MKKITSPTLIILMMNVTLYAQTTSASFDPSWAANLQAAIDNNFAAAELHGVSVAVHYPGQGTFYGTAGESSPGVPMTSDKQFGVGSNTKLFTAVLALKLQELGILSLDDPLSDWLLTYENVDGSATLRQCLKHQTGFFDSSNDIDIHEWYVNAIYGPEVNYSPEASLISLLGPPHFPVNEAWRYSNTNYVLVAMVMETASGKSYGELLHEYIFDPLDMDSTFLAIFENPNGTVADGWQLGANIGNVPVITGYSQLWSAGSIFSTTSEMVQWYRQLFNGNIISQESLDQLLDIEPASSYGFGINFDYFIPGDDAFVHTGSMPGYITLMAFDKKTGFIISLFTNENNDDQNNSFVITLGLLTELMINYPRADDDAGIIQVTSPSGNNCIDVTSFTPEVIIQNFGTASLTSAVINYQVDENPIQSYLWSGSLLQDETAAINLPVLNVSAGYHSFRAFTSAPNGNTEGYEHNNETTSKFQVSSGTLTLLMEEFEGIFPPAGWVNGNNSLLDWRKSSLSLLSGSGSAMKSFAFDRSAIPYDLELPLLDLGSVSNPVLSFNYSYGYWFNNDKLEVLVSTDCGESYHTVFQKSGPALKTVDATGTFFPKDEDWILKTLNLSAYKSSEVLIKFHATSGNGNNLYIDNVSVLDNSELCAPPTDLDAANITASSAKLMWQFHDNAVGFKLYYREKGASLWSTKTLAGNKRNVVLKNLNIATDYEWYVTATCRNISSAPAPVSLFSTLPARMEEEFLEQLAAGVFPNPTSSSVTIQFELEQTRKLQLTLFDVSGRLVEEWSYIDVSGPFAHQIDVSSLCRGIYLIKIIAGDAIATQKLIVD